MQEGQMKNKKKGQAIVELAVVFPFFLLIILGGIIDFGFAFYNYVTLQGIANDAASWAAENSVTGDSAVTNFVNATAKKPTWMSKQIAATVNVVSLPSGVDLVRVNLTYDSPVYTPFYQTMFSATTGSPSIPLGTMAAYQIPQL